jgi:hypothetical protein
VKKIKKIKEDSVILYGSYAPSYPCVTCPFLVIIRCAPWMFEG